MPDPMGQPTKQQEICDQIIRLIYTHMPAEYAEVTVEAMVEMLRLTKESVARELNALIDEGVFDA